MNVSTVFRRSFGPGLALVGALGVLPAATALADDPPAPPGPHTPPPEAYSACESKSSGDTCTAPMHGGDVKGTCMPDRESGRLFCRPEGRPPPPPQAFDACSGKKETDACTVTFGDRSVEGACRAVPDGRLACAPSHPPDQP